MTAPVPIRPRRLAYLGNPEAAVPPLRALVEAAPSLDLEVVRVVTSPPRRRGRRADPTPTPVGAVALELGLPVAHDLDALTGGRTDGPSVEGAAGGIDLAVVVAFGRIIPVDLLDRIPMVNLHFSLLPRWRGAAPVERALMAGDHETGVCLMDVAEGLDTGGVRARAVTPIGPADTAADLRGRLSDLGAEILVDWLRHVTVDGPGAAEPQVGEPTWAHKLDRTDLWLDWDRTAEELHRLVRVGGAHTTFRGESLKAWAAQPVTAPGDVPPGTLVGDVVATGDGGLRLVEVQPAGRTRMAFDAWATGARPDGHERLGA